MALEAGKLRHRLELQRRLLDSDGQPPLDTNGEQVDDWETFATVWGAIYPVSAREFVQSQAVQEEVVARMTIRYRADVDSTVRIRHGGKIYNIAGVLPDPESGREYLTLPVTQGVNEG